MTRGDGGPNKFPRCGSHAPQRGFFFSEGVAEEIRLGRKTAYLF